MMYSFQLVLLISILLIKQSQQALDSSLLTTSGNVSLLIGNPLDIGCTLNGDFLAANITLVHKASQRSVDRFNQTSLLASNKTVAFFKLSAVQERDDGEYVCTAITKAGNVSRSVFLLVMWKPAIESLTPSLTVRVDESFQLMCIVYSNPPPKVIWYSPNGSTIVTNVTRVSTYRYRSDLLISQAKKNLHHGVFICLAQGSGGITFQMTVVNVTGTLFIPGLKGSTLPLMRGVNGAVQCALDGYSPVAKFALFQRSRTSYLQPFIVSSNASMTVATFDFGNVSLEHRGDYDCVAELSTVKGNATFFLDVIWFPTMQLDASVTILEGATLRLNCNVSCNPAPSSVIWTAPSQDYTVNVTSPAPFFYQHSLIVPATNSSRHRGIYTCRAVDSQLKSTALKIAFVAILSNPRAVPTPPTTQQSTTEVMSEAGKNIMAKVAKYEASVQAGNFDEAAEMYTTDCRLIFAGSDVQIGRDAVKQLLNSFHAKGMRSIASKADELLGKQGDEFIIVRGHYDALTAAGESMHKGRFVSIFKLVDGDYFCHVDAECA